MPLFTMFVVAAVITGSGSLLSPAWHTRQPRIGLAATFLLALLVGGAVFWTEFFGWDTLIIDYLLFALVMFVVLGGTLSQAQVRAEALGETLPDADQGWTSVRDLLFLLCAGVVFMVPALIIQLPMGEQGALNAFLTFITRQGQTFESLSPYHPDITVLQAPGFHGLSSYLNQQLAQSIYSIQIGVAVVVAWLSVWAIYDLGSETQDKRAGRMIALAFIFSSTPLSLLLNGYYTVLLALFFSIAALVYIMRYRRDGLRMDMIAGGLMMGAVLYSNFTIFVLLLAAYVIFLILLALTTSKVSTGRWSGLVVGLPGAMLIGTAPWLWNNLPLLSHFEAIAVPARNPGWIFVFTGVWLLPAAMTGLYLAWTQRRSVWRDMIFLCVGWLLTATVIAIVGVPGVLSRFVQPQIVLWAGFVLPGSIFAGVALLWLWTTVIPDDTRTRLYPYSEAIIIGAGILMLIGMLLVQPILALGQERLDWQAATATPSQVEAMQWIADNSPSDARILNDPALTWAASITERDVINVPFSSYFDQQPATDETDLFAYVQAKGESEAILSRLRSSNVTHVLSQQPLAHPFLEPVFETDDAFMYAIQD